MKQSVDKDQTQETQNSPHGVVSRWLEIVGAVLIVAGIIGVTVALVRNYNAPLVGHTAPPAGPVGTPVGPMGAPVTRMVQAGGLDFMMQVTPGPYFLGELLQADLSLHNDSHTTYTLGGLSEYKDSLCRTAIFLDVSGGSTPQYVLPVAHANPNISCNIDSVCSQLRPGDTMTLHDFLLVSNTGQVILQSGATFLQTATDSNGYCSQSTAAHSPLDGLWPSLTLSVAAATPSDRQIALQREGSQVRINAPAAALAHLYYFYTVTCNAVQGGTVRTGNYGWEPISPTPVQEPNCGDEGSQVIEWSYAVSAPGYAIAAGQLGS